MLPACILVWLNCVRDCQEYNLVMSDEYPNYVLWFPHLRKLPLFKTDLTTLWQRETARGATDWSERWGRRVWGRCRGRGCGSPVQDESGKLRSIMINWKWMFSSTWPAGSERPPHPVRPPLLPPGGPCMPHWYFSKQKSQPLLLRPVPLLVFSFRKQPEHWLHGSLQSTGLSSTMLMLSTRLTARTVYQPLVTWWRDNLTVFDRMGNLLFLWRKQLRDEKKQKTC